MRPKQHLRRGKDPHYCPRSFDRAIPCMYGVAGFTVIRFFMAVRIRLKRVGAKNSPVFRVVVADARSPRDGKFIEELGTYHPLKKGDDNFTLNLERARYWVGVGALPSDTVHSMIKRAGRKATA